MKRIDSSDHFALPWLVHELATDYEIEDIWRMPVVLHSDDSLSDFWHQMQLAITEMNPLGMTAVLFRIRFALGRVFGWEAGESKAPKELRRRYEAMTGEEGKNDESRKVGDFWLVYALKDEYLAEIENGTVQAALHLGRAAVGDGTSSVNLAVYVKPKGTLGRLYMSAIKPFRLWIVYPAILKAAGRQWEKFSSG